MKKIFLIIVLLSSAVALADVPAKLEMACAEKHASIADHGPGFFSGYANIISLGYLGRGWDKADAVEYAYNIHADSDWFESDSLKSLYDFALGYIDHSILKDNKERISKFNIDYDRYFHITRKISGLDVVTFENNQLNVAKQIIVRLNKRGLLCQYEGSGQLLKSAAAENALAGLDVKAVEQQIRITTYWSLRKLLARELFFDISNGISLDLK